MQPQCWVSRVAFYCLHGNGGKGSGHCVAHEDLSLCCVCLCKWACLAMSSSDVLVCRWRRSRRRAHGCEREDPDRCLSERGTELSGSGLERRRGKRKTLKGSNSSPTLMARPFVPAGLGRRRDCRLSSEGIRGRSVSIAAAACSVCCVRFWWTSVTW